MPDDHRRSAADAFCASAGWGAASRRFLAGDASARRYERLQRPDGKTAVLMDAPPASGEDIDAFVRIGKHLRALELSAPEVIAADLGAGFLLLEDLGDRLFSRTLCAHPEQEQALYSVAVEAIRRLQSAPSVPGLPPYGAAEMAEAVAPAIEFYRFASCGQRDGTQALQGAMFRALDRLPPAPPVMIFRDYHAENLLWLPERGGVAAVGILDFELARIGHPAYDLVSLLQDARRDISTATEQKLIADFAASRGVSEPEFRHSYSAVGAQRHIRILGVFTRLALVHGKTGYLVHLPRVWRDLQRCLADPMLSELADSVNRWLSPPHAEVIRNIEEECRTPLTT